MSEFSSAQQAQKNTAAYAAALQRARQVAAKIDHSGNKRPLEDGPEPNAKKIAGLDSSGDYQNQSVIMGGSITGGPHSGGPGGGNMPPQSLPEPNINEYIRVPDKMVGLIIGRGGEQITRLQFESGCKIQMAPDSGGQAERVCTLTGSREAVNRAKEMVNGIVNQRGRDGGPPDNGPQQQRMGGQGQNYEEIMILGSKVGLIIGKGGQTIKQLQEKSGAKMVIIQEGPNPEYEKPLRITGNPQQVEHAKQLVYELIAEKEMQYGGGPRGGGSSGGPNKPPGNNSGSNWGSDGGFDQQNDSDGHDQRRDQDRQGGQRGPPRNGDSGGPSGPCYSSWDTPQENKIEVSFTVLKKECGIIIGPGGEVIRQINSQSGAHCEIDRRSQNSRGNRTFFIRGNPENVEAAKRIISEKVGTVSAINFVESGISGGGNQGGGGGNGGGPQGGNSGDYGGGYGGGPVPSAPNAGGGGGGNVPMWGYNPQWHPSQQQQQQQQEPQNQQQPVSINPVTGQPDYSQQWIDYYRSMGLGHEAEKIEQQQKANKNNPVAAQQQQQPTSQHPQSVPSANGSNSSTPGMPNMSGGGGGPGQTDYSAQWAEYYRSVGKVKEAEMIESTIKPKSGPVGGAPSVPSGNAVGGYGGGGPYQPQPYQQQQHYANYGPYPGYPQSHPAPPDQQQ